MKIGGVGHEIGIPTIFNTKALSEGDEVVVLKTSAAASDEPDLEQPQAKKHKGEKGEKGKSAKGKGKGKEAKGR